MTGLTAEQRAAVEQQLANGQRGRGGAQGAAEALAEARVDLVGMIRDGIPPREWLPGSRLLIRGTRALLVAPAGTGKSLVALVIAVEIVEAGGAVAIIDVENGAVEYARRLERILASRDPAATQACVDRLRYYAWPALSLAWAPAEWAAAVADVGLVVFDSSRLALSSVGLAEDKADDYAAFVAAFLTPLSRAGITTLVLDNTGHEERDRARGSSTKGDLNEVVYAMKVTAKFSDDLAGELELKRTRTRFADVPERLTMTIGDGTYRGPEPAEPGHDTAGFRPTALMAREYRVIEENPGLTKAAIRTAVPGKTDPKLLALELLINEGHVEVRHEGQAHRHYPARPYPKSAE